MSSIYLRRTFWSDAIERAVRATATWSLTSFGLDKVTGILNVDLQAWASGAVMVVIVSILTSLVGARFGDDSASFVSK